MLVLVVDDHPTNRLLLQRQLNTLGYAAETAEDGNEALSLWKSGRFTVVITDCEMPGMSGYELARRIREHEQSEGRTRTPILACTAHALAGEVDKCIAAGMDNCLVKPVDLRSLQVKLACWLPLVTEPPADKAAAGEAPASAHAVPIDLSRVVATWGDDPAGIHDILQFFRRTNDEDTTMLQDSVARRDLPLAMRTAHRMLGSSKVVGAGDFAAVCDRIHRACRSANWPAVLTELSALEAERARLNAYLESIAPGPMHPTAPSTSGSASTN